MPPRPVRARASSTTIGRPRARTPAPCTATGPPRPGGQSPLGALHVGLTLLVASSLALGFFGWCAAVLIGGLAALSSTVLRLKLLLERGEMDAPHGCATLGILLLRDLLVIPMMLAVPIRGRADPPPGAVRAHARPHLSRHGVSHQPCRAFAGAWRLPGRCRRLRERVWRAGPGRRPGAARHLLEPFLHLDRDAPRSGVRAPAAAPGVRRRPRCSGAEAPHRGRGLS